MLSLFHTKRTPLRILKSITAILLMLTVFCALIACGGGNAPCTEHIDTDANGKCDVCDTTVEPSGSGGDTNGDTGADLALVTDSKTGFAVLIADALTDRSEGYVNDFIKNLNRYYLEDSDLKTNYDAPGFDDAIEIVFGAPKNRGNVFEKDEHYLGYKGFSIELIGNKLFVLGGGDKGYQDAIKYLEDTLFDLESYEDTIDELVIPKGTKYESIPTDYDISEFTINNTPINDFVISYDNSAKDAATTLRNTIYKDAGFWLPYVALNDVTDGQKVIYVEFTKGDSERTTDEGFTVYVKDGNLHIECEFENKFEETVNEFIDSKLSSSKVKIASSYTFTKDVRNIYYNDFGARGNGIADDFFAIKACHDEANKYGHTVNGNPGSTYYIGDANGTESIIVATDTYWNLCSFIFDDRVLADPGTSKAFNAPIFKITPSEASYVITGKDLPVTSLPIGSTAIENFAPGKRVMVHIYDDTKRHHIRYGSNRNNGTAQEEIILVNADGTIDPTTPLQWDYTTLSKMEVYPVDEAPLILSGGTKDQIDNYGALGVFTNFDCIDRAHVHSILNDARSEYKYHARNIEISRSNVIVKNIEHTVDDDVETSAPYAGFVNVIYATDVVIEGMVFEKAKYFYTVGSSGKESWMGSYEMHADCANNVTWRNCRHSNFFEPDGSVVYKGYMGTNYCKNLTFDNMTSCSFDAHCSLYNGTVKNSTLEHINFIGAGTIRLENVTVYTDGKNSAIVLRQDYGSTWRGNVIIDGLTLRSSTKHDKLTLIRVDYVNHFFGYTCHIPEKIEMNNVKVVQYGFKVEGGVRTEWDVATNNMPLHFYKQLETYTTDISNPNADMTSVPNDYKKCNCESVYNGKKTFNDTDGDGRCDNDLNPKDNYSLACWGFKDTPATNTNTNPYVTTKEIYVTNCKDLQVILPSTPQFKNTELYVDGVLQDD